MPKHKKNILYKKQYYSREALQGLMTALAGDGYTVTLRCFAAQQWEFVIETKDNHSVSGIGFGPFYAAEICFWNWEKYGLRNESTR